MSKNSLYQAISIATLCVSSSALAADDVTLKTIMQGLRDNFVEITDGFLTNDFEMIARGAAAIASHPQIPADQVKLVAAELGEEMPAFKQMDTVVHDLSLEIEAAAKVGDWGSAISAYQQMFNGCLACHEQYQERVVAALGSTTEQ